MSTILRKLPVELRIMIWKPLLTDAFTGQMPNIIKALRPDEEIYHEVIAIFCKSNSYVLHAENDWGFADMMGLPFLASKMSKLSLSKSKAS